MKKNIVFVIESLHLGGAEKTLITLLQNLDYSKYNVDLITFKKEGFFNDFVPEQVNQIVINFPKLNLIDRVKYAIKRKLNKNHHSAQLLWPIISKYFRNVEKKYDIAIAYNQGFATYFVSEYLKANKMFSWLNINYDIAGYNIDFDYNFYKNYNEIICVSNEVKITLDAKVKSRNFKINTKFIKDIVEFDEILVKSKETNDYNFNSDSIKIVSVGRLAKQKAFHLAIEAAKLLVDKGYNIEWLIVGEGEERDYLENLINKKQIKDSIKLIGAKINPYSFMNMADIFVQTSLFEGLGTTLLEASVLKKPIVTTNFPSAFTILKHEETGLICEMNAVSLANSIERLILDENLKRKFVNNLALQENKDKEITLNQIEELLN